jgi:hypothetical protein
MIFIAACKYTLQVANMVGQMQVKCGGGEQDPPSKKRKGAEGDVSAAASDAACDWTGKLEDNGKHQAICAFALVSCKWAGCAVSVMRKELQTHEDTLCEHRKRPCKHAGCTELLAAKDLETHQTKCIYRMVHCPNVCCRKEMQQREYSPGVAPHESHHSTCGFAEVQCDFPGGGCVVKVLRKDMDKHHQEGIACVRVCVCVCMCVIVYTCVFTKNGTPRCVHSLFCFQNAILTVIITAAAGKHLAAVQTSLLEVIKTQGQTPTNTLAKTQGMHIQTIHPFTHVRTTLRANH